MYQDIHCISVCTGIKCKTTKMAIQYCITLFLSDIEWVQTVTLGFFWFVFLTFCFIFEDSRIKIAGRNINNFRYADDTTLMAESKKELNSLLKLKVESLRHVQLFVTPLTVACQALPSMGFSR